VNPGEGIDWADRPVGSIMSDRMYDGPNRIFTILAALVLMAFLVAPAAAQGSRRPQRPPPGKEPQQLREAEEAREAVREWWEDARKPDICVIVGQSDAGTVRYGDSTLTRPLRQELISELRAANIRITVADIRADLRERGLNALQRAEGDRMSADAMALLSDHYAAEVIIDFAFLRGTNGYQGGMDVYNTRTAEFITAKAFGQPITGQMDAVVAGNWARTFMKLLSEVPLASSSTSKMVAFISGLDDAFVADDIAIWLEDESPRAETASSDITELEDGSKAARLEVEYDGDARRFRRDLLRAAEDVGLGLEVKTTQGNIVTAQVFKDEAPDWWVATETRSDEFEDAIRKRQRFARDRSLNLGLYVGDAAATDLRAARDAFDGGNAPRIGFANERLQNALRNQFSDLGFRVIDDEATADRIGNMVASLENRAPIEGVEGQIWDQVGFDWALVTKVQRATDEIIVELIDVTNQSFVTSTSFPNRDVPARGKYAVDSDDADEVARFLTGQLMPRMDRYLENQEQARQLLRRRLGLAEIVHQHGIAHG